MRACCQHGSTVTQLPTQLQARPFTFHKETRADPPCLLSPSAWQLINGTTAFGHSLRPAPQQEARQPLVGTVCRWQPSEVCGRVGQLEIAGESRPLCAVLHRPGDSVDSAIATVHYISTLHTGVRRPGYAPTPRLPSHCPVKGPELNYLGTPSSRLSRPDNVESLQRDCLDIISHPT